MSAEVLQRILLVEDDPDIQFIAKLSLKNIGGYSVELCSSGEEALAQVAGIAPDLILLDVMMPGMDGLTTYRMLQAREDTAAIPIIFLTAKVQPEDQALYKRMGALDFIPKPFDPRKLPVTVGQMWQRHKHLQCA